MSNQAENFPLDWEAFKEWVEKQPSTKVVGEVGNPERCPIACYLDEPGRWRVGETMLVDDWFPRHSDYLPSRFQAFVRLIDSYGTVGDFVHAWQALEAEIELGPLRNQLRAQQLRGARGVVAAALGREQPPLSEAHRITQGANTPAPATNAHESPDDEPPDGSDPTASHRRQKVPSAPDISGFVAASYSASDGAYNGNGHRPINIHRSASAKRARKRIVSDGLTTRQLAQRNAAYAILDAQPAISQRKLAAEIKCGPAQAKRYREMWLTRNAQRASLAAAE